MSELAELVSPTSVEEFLQEIYGKSWGYFPGPDHRFKKLAGWETLNSILATQRFDWPRFRIARQGCVLPVENYTNEITIRTTKPYRQLNLAKFLEELRGGATLAVDHFDEAHPPLRSLAHRLEAELRAPAFIDAFASWAPVPGFDVHWDDLDVFVIQIEGSKHWRIWNPTREWPLYHDVAETPRPSNSDIAVEVDISSGDVLYVPHGWWHSVSATREPSLHLAVGVIPNTGLDLLGWLVQHAYADELFRRRLPRFSSPDERGKYIDSFRERWNGIMNMTDLLERFFANSDGAASSRLDLNLPDILSENSVLASRGAAVAMLTSRVAVTNEEDGYVFAAVGRRWKFPKKFRSLLDFLISNHLSTVEEIIDANRDLHESEIAGVIFQLQRVGIVKLID